MEIRSFQHSSSVANLWLESVVVFLPFGWRECIFATTLERRASSLLHRQIGLASTPPPEAGALPAPWGLEGLLSPPEWL